MKNYMMIATVAVTLLSSCGDEKQKEQERAQNTIDSLKSEASRQHAIDSMNAMMMQNPGINTDVAPGTAKHTTATSTTHHSTGTRGGASTNSSSTTTTNSTTPANSTSPANTTTTTTTTTTKRKGLTGAETGALVGAGAGAITGAMVDKKKGEGAIVGGLLGAGAGAGVGALIQKHKKNKEEKAAAEDK